MIKDAADLFAEKGEGAKGILERLKQEAQDALDSALAEAPEGSKRERYRHAKEGLFPLISRLGDPGERAAALDDVAAALKLGKKDLREAFSAAEEPREEPAEEDEDEAEKLAPEPGSERHERATALLECPDVLEKLAEDMERLGHVGDTKNKKLAFVCAVSAKAGRPVQPSTHAQSSSGKNFLWDKTIEFLPPEMIIKRSAISDKALFRTGADLRGAVLYLQEMVGSEGADFAIRVLQSAQYLEYEATERMPDGTIETVVHRQEGPVVVVQTTTKNHLFHENETRVLPIYVDESEEQTRRIVENSKKAAAGKEGVAPEERELILLTWHDAIRLLEPGEVIVPYAVRIEMPTSHVRVRRDVGKILDVVRIVAWLHQHRRERDERDRILATEDDFCKALELVEESLGRAWKSLTPSEEAVAKAVEALPEARRRNGFRRSDLTVRGVSDRQVQEALKSLASTGYLDSDGKRGPQGHTYTLVRTPEEVGTGIRLRPPGDGGGDATSEDDFGAREGERAPESRLDAEDEEDHPGAEDDPEAGDLHLEEAGERSGDDTDGEGEDPLEELTRRGWFRVRELPSAPDRATVVADAQDLEKDPMADRILGEVTLYDPGWERDAWVATDAELAEACGEDPTRARDRLVGMLPALQAERQYFDPCAWFYGTSSDQRKYFRRGFMHVERWEKEGEQDGLRVFLPLKPRWSVPERYVEECVLYSVRLIEDPKVDDGLGEFDWDDR